MIHINSYKLTPAITATWGDITGNVSNQEDLVEYISEHGGNAAWGSISGVIEDQEDLMSLLGSYATESWVSSQQFATESWVSGQGYLTSVPSDYLLKSNVSGNKQMLFSPELPKIYMRNSLSSQLTINPTLITLFGDSYSMYLTSNTMGLAGPSDVGVGMTYGPVELSSEYTLTIRGSESNATFIGLDNIYLKESGSLTTIPFSNLKDMATQSWVESQGYLQSTSLKTVNNQSLVGTGNIEIGGLTPEQSAAIAPLVNKTNGYLKYKCTTKPDAVGFIDRGTQALDQYGQIWVYEINGEVYYINWMNLENRNISPYIYKWNRTNFAFELLTYQENDTEYPVQIWNISPDYITAVTDPHEIWCDSQGRYYLNNEYIIDFSDPTGWNFQYHPMGGTLQTYNGRKSNIIKLSDGNIYMLYGASTAANARAWVFNESTQVFDAYGSGASFSGYAITNFYRYVFYYNDAPYFTRSNTGNFLYQFTISSTRITATNIVVASRPFPTTITYDGATYQVTGDRIRKFRYYDEVEEKEKYMYFFYYGQLAWKLVNGEWVYFDINRLDSFSYNTNGVEAGDLLFGFGYDENRVGEIPVWNFTEDILIEDYGWDNTVDSRFKAIEDSLGDAETITQNILGY